MSDKRDVLLENRNILSDKLVSRINAFLNYEDSSSVRIVAISNEEKLKAKACSALESESSFIVEGYATSQTEVEVYDLLLADYIVVHTAALRMAPLQLVNTLRLVDRFNKKAFVIVDKWDMLTPTKENIEKVRKNAIKEFSMLNIVGIYNVGESKDLGLETIEEVIGKIQAYVATSGEQVKGQQVDKIYEFYLDAVKSEYLNVKGQADEVRAKIESYITSVDSFHSANSVKIKSVSSELNMYSQDLYTKWNLISIEECVGDMSYDDVDGLRKHILNEYVQRVMKDYTVITKTVLDNYKRRLGAIREKVLEELYQIIDKIEGLKYTSDELVEKFRRDVDELETIDNIMNDIQSVANESMAELERKVKQIASKTFDEETLQATVRKKIEELISMIKSEGEKDSVSQNIMGEASIRKYYADILEKCTTQLFSTVDEFVSVLKQNLNKKSENIFDTYYTLLGKDLSEIETAVEKEYIVL
ncbi:hypothetical protein [Butyrivibrio sp. XBB1001]|uniref:hypothetical protein n=1 Tax=Butyrivibrio sp. XBB1001 TaxID=1280682 RepID=UPI0003FEA582|nr:hypothetical protein [Butyrivibrio sp. XBB1001]